MWSTPVKNAEFLALFDQPKGATKP
jgi:hypothetical protein